MAAPTIYDSTTYQVDGPASTPQTITIDRDATVKAIYLIAGCITGQNIGGDPINGTPTYGNVTMVAHPAATVTGFEVWKLEDLSACVDNVLRFDLFVGGSIYDGVGFAIAHSAAAVEVVDEGTTTGTGTSVSMALSSGALDGRVLGAIAVRAGREPHASNYTVVYAQEPPVIANREWGQRTLSGEGTYAATIVASSTYSGTSIVIAEVEVAPTPPSQPTMRVPVPGLRIELFSNEDTNWGPDDCVGIAMDAHKIGWAQWSRFPPQAFFTLRKSSVYNERIVAGLSHVRIWYSDPSVAYGPELVFNGRIGDADESRDDVVWRCHGYLAELALSRTGYRVMYQGRKIGNVVRREINQDAAKGKFVDYGARKQTFGLFRHVGLGTIQNPQNSSGKAVKLESGFGVIDVPRLLFLFDLTEIGRANTADNVVMEVSRSTNPEFNFWRNRGSAPTGMSLRVPGNVRNYRFVRGVADVRNDLASIGTRKGQAREIKATRSDGTYGYEAFGRRQDTFSIRTLAGFRNLDEESGRFSAQRMIVRRAVKEATRPTREIALDIPVERMQPFDGWDIEDYMPVEIDDGRTQIDTDYRIVGVQGLMDAAGYRQTIYVVPKDA